MNKLLTNNEASYWAEEYYNSLKEKRESVDYEPFQLLDDSDELIAEYDGDSIYFEKHWIFRKDICDLHDWICRVWNLVKEGK